MSPFYLYLFLTVCHFCTGVHVSGLAHTEYLLSASLQNHAKWRCGTVVATLTQLIGLKPLLRGCYNIDPFLRAEADAAAAAADAVAGMGEGDEGQAREGKLDACALRTYQLLSLIHI